MKKIKTVVIFSVLIAVIIAFIGIYKFNYLSGKSNHDVDGNKIENNNATK